MHLRFLRLNPWCIPCKFFLSVSASISAVSLFHSISSSVNLFTIFTENLVFWLITGLTSHSGESAAFTIELVNCLFFERTGVALHVVFKKRKL